MANQDNKTQDRSSSQGKQGNFKNNPERASEAGKKGGEASHGGNRRS